MSRALLIAVVAAVAALGACRTQPLPARPPADLAPVLDLAPVVDAGCDGGLNACGECGPTPDEECNGRDDDCDGVVDEGCARRLDPAQSVPASRVRLAGDRAVYLGGTPIVFTATPTDVWAVDLRDGTHARLASAAGLKPDGHWDLVSGADTDGRWAVWQRSNGSMVSLGAVSLETGATRTRAAGTGSDFTEPSLARGVVTWGEGELKRAVSWDLATDGVEPLALGARPSTAVRDGDWLALVLDGSRVVQARRYSDGKLVEIAATAGSPQTRSVDVDGTRVVFQSVGYPDGGYVTALQLADVAAGTSEAIAPDLGGSLPRVSGTLVCFVANDQAVWVVDAATGRRLRLASRGASCDVSGRRVAWISAVSDGLIFTRELAPSEP